MKKIPLKHGHVALVDDEDYEWLMQWKWTELVTPSNIYARRAHYKQGVQETILMHQVIHPTAANLQTDHINQNGLDNRRENLRSATASQNTSNRGKYSTGTSQFKGVSWHKGTRKWQAQIKANHRAYQLGYYANEIDAAKAYDAAARTLHGDFANINFSED